MDDDSRLCGEIDVADGLSRLAAILARGGVRAQQRESCHFTGGWYLRVEDEDEAYIAIECIARGEFLVRGDADALAQLIEAAVRLSQALAATGTRHRFEIYDGAGDLQRNLEHRWPQPGDGG